MNLPLMDLPCRGHWHNHFPYIPPHNRPGCKKGSKSDPASDPWHRRKIKYFAPGTKVECDSKVLEAGRAGKQMYGKEGHRTHDHTATMQRENNVRRIPINLNCVVTASSKFPVVREASVSIALSAKVAVVSLLSSSTFGSPSNLGVGLLLLVT